LEKLDFIGHHNLFVGCPACPRGSEQGPIYIMADGNFVLSRHKNADNGYFHRITSLDDFIMDDSEVTIQELKETLSSDSKKNDKSKSLEEPCSNFHAMDSTYSRTASQYRDEKGCHFFLIIGIFGIFCARHSIPLKFVSIMEGERYGKDFFFILKGYFDHLMNEVLKSYGSGRKYFLFYDIACKYGINFFVYMHS
jgi:hypothetical protein